MFNSYFPNVDALSTAFILGPIACVGVSIVVVRDTFALLVVNGPRALVPIIVRGVVNSTTILLILRPLPRVLFSVIGHVYPIPLTFAFCVFPFMNVSILMSYFSFAI